jgi:hypothetical protein
MLWLVVVIGAVMFCWFEKVTFLGSNGYTTIRIGAVQPWLVLGDHLVSYAPNFLTVSGLAGLVALVAGVALACARRPKVPTIENNEPRLSRLALWGAILVPLFSFAFVAFTAFMVSYDHPRHSGWAVDLMNQRKLWFITVAVVVAVIGVSTPFATTILGGVAIAKIKNSGGTLYGLRLAAADLLAFPLLVLAGLAATGTTVAWGLLGLDKPGTAHAPVPEILVALAVCIFAGRTAWRSIVSRPAVPLAPPVAPIVAKPSPRHLLSAALVLLCLFGFFFGLSFQAKTGGTAAGVTEIITVGALDPLFVREKGPSGFETSLNFFSWSFFAVVVGGIAFGALWRIGREDQGKVPRDAAWWRDWWKQVGIWGGLLLIVCIVRTVKDPAKVLQPPGDRSVSAKYNKQLAPASIPPLGTITNGIGAEFTVPAGQVAILEIVTRKDGATVPVPPHSAYVLAGEAAVTGTFRWSREPEQPAAGLRRWRIEVVSGAGNGSTGGIALPEALDEAVGAIGLTLGVLVPNEETVHGEGLVALRVTTVAHNLKTSGEGIATTEWKGPKTKSKP